MTFAYVRWSYGFLLVAAFGLFILWALWQRQNALNRFADKELVNSLANPSLFKKAQRQAFLLLSVLTLCVISLMRPQWGFHMENVRKRGYDILLAVDVSKSMLAQDVKPSRLERAKLAIRDFAKKLSGDRLGLIAFSGNAFLECPLTSDYAGFLMTLDDLSTTTITQGGTSLTGAIRAALKAYEGAAGKDKILILISDGEDNEGDALAAAREAREAGVRIFCIGIGTTEGELIPVIDQEDQKTFLKDREGRPVKSRLNEKLLQHIVLSADGAYVHASNVDFGLETLYKQDIARLEKKEFEKKTIRLYEERYQIFLFLALILLLGESLLENERRPWI